MRKYEAYVIYAGIRSLYSCEGITLEEALLRLREEILKSHKEYLPSGLVVVCREWQGTRLSLPFIATIPLRQMQLFQEKSVAQCKPVE